MLKITGKTKVVCIIGNPIHHSLSPLMHNAAFEEKKLNFVYVPFEVKEKDFRKAIDSIRYLGLAGANITIPYKEKALEQMDELTEQARLIGAVNTVVNHDGKLIGDNTDGTGFMQSLEENVDFKPKGKNIFILGAGGAARSITIALAKAGVQKIIISNRTAQRAYALSSYCQQNFPHIHFQVVPLEKNAIAKSFCEIDLFINSSSLGMDDKNLIDLPFSHLPKHCIVYDIVYKPLFTKILCDAMNLGLPIINGLEMLVHQGALSFKLWTQCEAPVRTMKEALKNIAFGGD